MPAILLMLFSTLAFTIMHVGVQAVTVLDLDGDGEPVPPLVVAVFRLLFGITVVIPFIVRDGLGVFRTNRIGMMIVRAALNTVAMLTFFTALALTDLPTVTALAFTAPLFATLLAILIFGERVGWRRWTAILVGFVGTVIVLRPGVGEVGWGEVLTIASALGWATVMIIIKDLGRTDSSVTITAYTTVLMGPMALIPALFVWQWPSWIELAALLGIGALGGGAQLTLAQALKMADTHIIMPFDFTRLIWATILSAAVFAVWPDIWSWIGGAVIFASGAYIAYRERIRSRQSPAMPTPPPPG
jgi:drug/metabolite transporter (DMT)-like permease